MRTAVIVLFLIGTCFGQTSEPSPAVLLSKDADAGRPVATDLAQVRRIYVANFGDDEISKQLQATLVASLVSSKKFVVTENEKKADAVLKGAALQKTSQEVHAYGSGTAVGAAGGGHQSSLSGSGGSLSGSSSGGFAAKHLGIDDSSVNTETIDRASASVRLINTDGDVIWTDTAESHGAKYKGALADVADKIVAQLMRDYDKASHPNPSDKK